MNSVADVWKAVLQQLGEELSQTTISTWFDETEAVEIQGSVLVLHCGNSFKKGYIESLFLNNIKSALFNLFSKDFEVRILDDDQMEEAPAPRQETRFSIDKYTFDTFVVGPSNKLAYAASKSVADYPAAHYNPLLIYGDSGLGKTHLIYAIANAIRARDPKAKITYAKGDDMTNELINAIQEGAAGEMREKYRTADLLLVDDVQFIAGKKQTQEEFFHTFNTLYESGRQIVLTSDRPPSEMTTLEDRLRTRFEWGLLVDVQPPDFETRVAIARTKAGHRPAGHRGVLHRGERHGQRPPAGRHGEQGHGLQGPAGRRRGPRHGEARHEGHFDGRGGVYPHAGRHSGLHQQTV